MCGWPTAVLLLTSAIVFVAGQVIPEVPKNEVPKIPVCFAPVDL